MRTAEFEYTLSSRLIAQTPPADRSGSRLLVVRRASRELEHRAFRDLPDILTSRDLLVVNDTRVIPARLLGHKTGTGGRVELLLLETVRDPGGERREGNSACWTALFRASAPPRPGLRLRLGNGRLNGEVLEADGQGRVTVRLRGDAPPADILEQEGVTPVPPYIKRGPGYERLTDLDRERYQTVYAARDGSVAAPTAGLHFTRELLGELSRRGVRRTAVTLHVGPGTFKPVQTELVEDHDMESERYAVGAVAAREINAARFEGRRVVAVGSTTVRTLESAARPDGSVAAGKGRSSLFIRPPYTFKVVDALLTNFHLPRSTLIMMVCAFAGRDLVLRAYEEAVRREYRFYSYGDCMLIL